MPELADTTYMNTPADSLRADSLYAPAPDSLMFHETLAPVKPPVEAFEVFGERSVLHDPLTFGGPAESGLFSDFIYQIPIICLFVVYFIYILAYGYRIAPFLRLSASRRGDKPDPEENLRLFSGFANGLWIITWLMLGITVTRMYTLWMPPELEGRLSPYFPFLITLGIAAVGIIISTVQRLILRAAGALTLSSHFTGRLLAIRRFTFVSFGIIAIPVTGVLWLARAEWALGMLALMALVVTAYIVYLLYRTLLLFFREKVSILFWFLYLCAVELMPYAILTAALVRGVLS